MSKSSNLEVKQLSLDLNNYRIVPQKNENGAISALIAIKRKNFYSILEDLIEDGFVETENIIVLDNGNELIVKEGNRRISALKIIHQHYNIDEFEIPENIKFKIRNISTTWLSENMTVPCLIYDMSEVDKVKKIIKKTHGKSENSGRAPWGSIATARLNKIENGALEPGLSLLEEYLRHGKNLTQQEKEEWGGDYSVTVLDQAISKLYLRIEEKSIKDLLQNYPKIKYRKEVEKILYDIGYGLLTFPIIRSNEDFLIKYNIPELPSVEKESEEDETLLVGEIGTGTNLTGIEEDGNEVSGNIQSNNSETGKESTGTEDAKAGESPELESVSGNAKSAKKGRSTAEKHFSKDRKNLIPKGTFKVAINNAKCNDIRKEFSTLDTIVHTNAAAVLFRVFIELSVDSYIEYSKLSNAVSSSASGVNLQQKIQIVASHLVTKKIADGPICKGILAEIKDRHGLLGIDTLHSYIHSNKFSPKAENLNITWNNISDFMKLLWDNTK